MIYTLSWHFKLFSFCICSLSSFVYSFVRSLFSFSRTLIFLCLLLSMKMRSRDETTTESGIWKALAAPHGVRLYGLLFRGITNATSYLTALSRLLIDRYYDAREKKNRTKYIIHSALEIHKMRQNTNKHRTYQTVNTQLQWSHFDANHFRTLWWRFFCNILWLMAAIEIRRAHVLARANFNKEMCAHARYLHTHFTSTMAIFTPGSSSHTMKNAKYFKWNISHCLKILTSFFFNGCFCVFSRWAEVNAKETCTRTIEFWSFSLFSHANTHRNEK